MRLLSKEKENVKGKVQKFESEMVRKKEKIHTNKIEKKVR